LDNGTSLYRENIIHYNIPFEPNEIPRQLTFQLQHLSGVEWLNISR